MNKYEFKMEDINEVRISNKNDSTHYSLQFIRGNNDKKLLFKTVHNALPQEVENFRINVMCPFCGKMNRYKMKYYNSKSFKSHCERCKNKVSYCDEDYVREYVIDYFTSKEKFSKVDIYINGIHIV